MKTSYLLFILLAIPIESCVEKYNPVINTQADVIVVQGLVTNLNESYKVIISMATPFDSSSNTNPNVAVKTLTANNVSIRDNLGNIFLLQWTPQYYYTDSTQFTAVPGRYYTLKIEMPNGDIYQSSAQKLLYPATLDSIYGFYDSKLYYFENALNQIVSVNVLGADNYINLSYPSDSIIQFRIDNKLLIFYAYTYWYTESMKQAGIQFPLPLQEGCPGPVCGYPVYCWKDFNLNQLVNLTLNNLTLASTKLSDVSVCFIPDPNRSILYSDSINSFFPIIYNQDSCIIEDYAKVCAPVRIPLEQNGQIFSTRIYSLNKASSLYYQEVNSQLSYQGKIFDPIDVQVQGNIQCINNPKKMVFGFFETSACVSKSYKLTYNYVTSRIIYQPVLDIRSLPDSGMSQNKPLFWTN